MVETKKIEMSEKNEMAMVYKSIRCKVHECLEAMPSFLTYDDLYVWQIAFCETD